MPRISTVGSGHGTPDYATLAAWWAAESSVDYSGLPIIAECLGNCGDNFTLSGASVNGAEIYTQGVTYDGTNQSSLAIITRLDLDAVINIHDVYLLSDNNFDFILELDAGADGSTIERCYLYHSGSPSGVDAVATNGSQPSTQILNCVINCNGCVNGFDLGFNHALQINNNVIFGATGDGIEGAGDSASLIIQNNFCFNNGTSDYSNIGASATFTNNASEDLTGQETGYTSSELVDFAGGDYRTKSASALATLGTGGGFIGAFLEAGGGAITVTGATPTYSYTAQTATIDLTGTIAVTGQTPSYSYTAVSASIDLTPEITVTGATATYSYSAINGVVELGAVINVVGQTPSYSYSAQNATVTLQGTIEVTGQTPSYSYTAISAAVQVGKIATNVSFVGTVKTAEFLGTLPQLEFSGTIKQQQFSGEIKQAASFIGARK